MMIGGKETKMESADGLLPANGDGSWASNIMK